MTAPTCTILRRTARALASRPLLTTCVMVHLGCVASILPAPRALVAPILSGGGDVPRSAPALRAGPGGDAAVLAELAAQAVRLCHDNNWSQQSVAALDRFLRETGELGPMTAELLGQADTIPAPARAVLFRTIARRSLAAREVASTERTSWPPRRVVERRLDITF